MQQESPACSLSGSQLVERIGEWAQVASRATSRHAEKGRIVSTYPSDRVLLQQLQELIAAEAECCPFMEFSVEEGPDQLVVELRVPDEMSETLAVMLGLVTPHGGQSHVETGPATSGGLRAAGRGP